MRMFHRLSRFFMVFMAGFFASLLMVFMGTANAECPLGEELVGEDADNWYCEPKAAITIYTRLSDKIGFVDISWFRNRRAYDETKPDTAKNLAYFVKFVLPHLNGEDAILVAWWAYIEGILDKPYAPWGFLNCLDPKGEINDTAGVDCKSFLSGGWQVGYGVQVFDQLKPDRNGDVPLRTVFGKIYPNSLPKEVGDRVLIGAGIKNLKFPALLDWQTLVKQERVENVLGSGRSNHFWASILMRDPKISAALEAPVIANFPCYKPLHPSWCDRDGYTSRREEDSKKLHSILNELKNIGYFGSK